MEIGSSPNAKRTATYSVHIDSGNPRTMLGITLEDLYILLANHKPKYLVIDNFLELVGKIKKLNSFLSRIPKETQLVQITLVDGTQIPLKVLAQTKLGWHSGKPTSSESAKLCVGLVKLGIGAIILGYHHKTLEIQPLLDNQSIVIPSKAVHKTQQETSFLSKRGIIINFGKGKDAFIYLSEYQGEFQVIKYYDPYSSSIGKIDKTYSSARHSNITMAKREAKILESLPTTFNSPKFIERSGPVIVMEAIGNYVHDKFTIAPQLSQLAKSNGDSHELLQQSIELLHTLVTKHHIIHGDFSPQNVLVKGDTLFLIDFAQSHTINMKSFTNTPYKIRLDLALNLLKQDLVSFCDFYLRKYRLEMDLSEIYNNILRSLPNTLLNQCDEHVLSFPYSLKI